MFICHFACHVIMFYIGDTKILSSPHCIRGWRAHYFNVIATLLKLGYLHKNCDIKAYSIAWSEYAIGISSVWRLYDIPVPTHQVKYCSFSPQPEVSWPSSHFNLGHTWGMLFKHQFSTLASDIATTFTLHFLNVVPIFVSNVGGGVNTHLST